MRENTATCIVCDQTNCADMIKTQDFEYETTSYLPKLKRCLTCQNIFVSPMPDHISQIGPLYPKTYYTINERSPLFLSGFIYQRKIAADAKRLIKAVSTSEPRMIMELGCGNIEKLVELRRILGNQVKLIGIDLDFPDAVISKARANHISLLKKNLEDEAAVDIPDGSCDLIIMSQLIEHLRDPKLILRTLVQKLSPTGKLLIETPSASGIDYKLFHAKYWGGYHMPRHFNIFTQKNLTLLIESQGFRVERQGFLPSPGFWIISLRNFFGLNSIARSKSLLEILNFSNLLVVAAFTAFDLLLLKLGFATSNQFMIASPLRPKATR